MSRIGREGAGWLERILLSQIGELKGEVKELNARMDGLEGKMNGEFRVVHSEIARVEETPATKIDDLNKRMDVTQCLVKLEEQLRELRSKA